MLFRISETSKDFVADGRSGLDTEFVHDNKASSAWTCSCSLVGNMASSTFGTLKIV